MKKLLSEKGHGLSHYGHSSKAVFYLCQVIRLSGTRFLRSFSAVSIPAVHLRIAEHVKTKLVSFS